MLICEVNSAVVEKYNIKHLDPMTDRIFIVLSDERLKFRVKFNSLQKPTKCPFFL